MNAIVCVDRQWGIGKQNELLVRIPADHHFFRKMTIGAVVLGGRKTMEGLPGGKALAERQNVVLSRQKDYYMEDAITVHSIEEVLTLLSRYKDRECFVIGGGKVYQEFLPYCDYVYVTKVDAIYGADTFFPNLDEDTDWESVRVSEEEDYRGLKYRFCEYRRSIPYADRNCQNILSI